jgi:hypothetical protein
MAIACVSSLAVAVSVRQSDTQCHGLLHHATSCKSELQLTSFIHYKCRDVGYSAGSFPCLEPISARAQARPHPLNQQKPIRLSLPATCQQCGKAPSLRQILIPEDNGDPSTEKFFMTCAILPRGSLFRPNRLLSEQGADVAAMGVDATNAIRRETASEKCWHTN